MLLGLVQLLVLDSELRMPACNDLAFGARSLGGSLIPRLSPCPDGQRKIFFVGAREEPGNEANWEDLGIWFIQLLKLVMY